MTLLRLLLYLVLLINLLAHLLVILLLLVSLALFHAIGASLLIFHHALAVSDELPNPSLLPAGLSSQIDVIVVSLTTGECVIKAWLTLAEGRVEAGGFVLSARSSSKRASIRGAHDLAADSSEAGETGRLELASFEQLDLHELALGHRLVSLNSDLFEHLLHASHPLGVLLEVVLVAEVPLILIETLVPLLQSAHDVLVEVDQVDILIIRGSHDQWFIGTVDVLD